MMNLFKHTESESASGDPEDIPAGWQEIVDLIARISGARAGLVKKITKEGLAVLASSSTADNPYPIGTLSHPDMTGSYCESVIRIKQQLLVPNALSSPQWNGNPDLKYQMISYLGFPVRQPDGTVVGTVCLLDDKENHYSPEIICLMETVRNLIEGQITRDLLKEQLHESEAKIQLITENITDVIWVYNLNTQKFTYVSPSIMDLRGYTVEEALKHSLNESLTPESFKFVTHVNKKSIEEFIRNPKEPKRQVTEVQQPCKDGTVIWVEIASSYRYNSLGEIEAVGSSRNIEDRKRKLGDVEYLLTHDPLTGLRNREALRRHPSDHGPLAAIFINLDSFRIVNDALGHQMGDSILKDAACSLVECCGEEGIPYRYGGDEFVVVMPTNKPQRIMELSNQIIKAVARQFSYNQQTFYITASVGIAIGNPDATVDQLIRNADTALYISKKEKNKITLYTPEMDRTRTREELLEKDLSYALDKGQFELRYQPIFTMNDEKGRQAEALLRWNHPQLGMISPMEFIPLAENTRLILPVTNWIIHQVSRMIMDLQEHGQEEIVFSVNLSALQMENEGEELLKVIDEVVEAYGINPAQLKFEITESLLIRSEEETIKVMGKLKKAGVLLALDDFGAGYSSLAYIRSLPFDIVKLDRTLVQHMLDDQKGLVLIESLISIIHKLGISVVAEGIETRAQLEQLRLFACDYGQGFYFSKPLPETDFIDFCSSWNTAVNPLVGKQEDLLEQFDLDAYWRKEWQSGVFEIDRQHKEMMRMANRLIDLHLEEKREKPMLEAVDELIEEVSSHFEYEERLLATYGFSMLEEHHEKHRQLLHKVHRLKDLYMKGEVIFTVFYSFVMEDFILRHMIFEDSRFFDFLRKAEDEAAKTQGGRNEAGNIQ